MDYIFICYDLQIYDKSLLVWLSPHVQSSPHIWLSPYVWSSPHIRSSPHVPSSPHVQLSPHVQSSPNIQSSPPNHPLTSNDPNIPSHLIFPSWQKVASYLINPSRLIAPLGLKINQINQTIIDPLITNLKHALELKKKLTVIIVNLKTIW